MNRIQKILCHEDYVKYLKKNKDCEKGRKYCKHNAVHFLDVARIGYILILEGGFGISKEEMYAAALLHDIGRWRQYGDGTPHEIASAELAEPILRDAEFSSMDIKEIIEAILAHRNSAAAKRKDLTGVLFRADKLSRKCLLCKMNDSCDWKHKNSRVEI